MFCKNCGRELEDGTAVCPGCGAEIAKKIAEAAAPASVEPAQYAAPAAPVKAKKKSGCLIALIVALCFLVVAVAMLWLLFPGLFGPRNLGVKPDMASYESAMAKLGYQKDAAPTGDSAEEYVYSYGEPKKVDVQLSGEEITSFLNINRPSYYALKDVQIRINEDDTMEGSAKVDIDYILDEVLDGRYSLEQLESSVPGLGLLPDDVNVYFKLDGGISGNAADGLNIEDVSVMGLPVPENMLARAQADGFIENGINAYLASITEKSGTTYDSLQIEDGQLHFKGSIPSSVTRTPIG